MAYTPAKTWVGGDVVLATDVQGNTQPEGRTENERGYGHNGWSDHGVTVAIS